MGAAPADSLLGIFLGNSTGLDIGGFLNASDYPLPIPITKWPYSIELESIHYTNAWRQLIPQYDLHLNT